MIRSPRVWTTRAKVYVPAVLLPTKHRRPFSRTALQRNQDRSTQLDVEALLSTPTWSVSALLPPTDTTQTSAVTPQQLRHLLRLCALPPPKDEAEEEQMLSTLSSQLHFVKSIQTISTTDVQPLRSLRDETAAGENEAEIGMEALKEAFEMEEVKGKHRRRIWRRNVKKEGKGEEWDVLGTAERKVGRYFVVEGGKEG